MANPVTTRVLSQAERREQIIRDVLAHGSVQIDDLAERFHVSRMTIHRDIDELERQGVVRKVRNGATAQPSSQFESDIRYRLQQCRQEKEALAHAALSKIEPGQSLLLDEATTLLPLIKRLPSVGPLTVITNFLPALTALIAHRHIHVIVLGGEYLPQFATLTGMLTERMVASLHADLYITSTTAIHEAHAWHPNQQIVTVKQLMMQRSARRYLLADHTKFGKTALYNVAPLSTFDAVIVDSGMDPMMLAQMREGGIHVEIAHLENTREEDHAI